MLITCFQQSFLLKQPEASGFHGAGCAGRKPWRGPEKSDLFTCAVSASDVQLVTLVTYAAEHAKDILTLAVHAQIGEHVAFIDVCKESEPQSINCQNWKKEAYIFYPRIHVFLWLM